MPLKKNKTISEKIEEVTEHRMKILEVRDNVPWLRRSHERSLTLYTNYCFCAKKVYE